MEEKQIKKWSREWWNERKLIKFMNAHPDGCMNLLGGALTLAAAILGAKVAKKSYDDNVYVETSEGSIYKIPGKQMKTIKKGGPINTRIK